MRPTRAIQIVVAVFIFGCICSLDLLGDGYLISTIAGNGKRGYAGDGGPATSAMLNDPTFVFVDADDNIYIADTGNRRIRKVDASGTITTIAGNGLPGNSGNGGPATSASLFSPEGVCADAEGNLYIADCGDGRIRKVDKTGTIDVFAGGGTSGYSGDGGPALLAKLNSPDRVFMDGKGNLYIADEYNNRIRKVDSCGTISTFAGDGGVGFSGEGDGGLATLAKLSGPVDVVADNAGNVYIADRSGRIRKVEISGTISTIAGNGDFESSGDGGPATSAHLSTPAGVSLDSAGNVYIAEASGYCIRKVGTSGFITTIAGSGESGYSGDGGPATSARLNRPVSVSVDRAGNVFISDRRNHVIRKLYRSN